MCWLQFLGLEEKPCDDFRLARNKAYWLEVKSSYYDVSSEPSVACTRLRRPLMCVSAITVRWVDLLPACAGLEESGGSVEPPPSAADEPVLSSRDHADVVRRIRPRSQSLPLHALKFRATTSQRRIRSVSLGPAPCVLPDAVQRCWRGLMDVAAPRSWKGRTEIGEARMLQQDRGVDLAAGEFTYGPETIQLSGSAPPGVYRVLVSTADGSRLDGECANLHVYSPMSIGGRATSVTIGQKGLSSQWWLPLDIEIDPEHAIGFKVLDLALTRGPTISGNTWTGNFGVPSTAGRETRYIFYYVNATQECDQISYIGLMVRNAQSDVELPLATYRVDGGVLINVAETQLVPTEGGITGGRFTREGPHVLQVTHPGYIPKSRDINLEPGAAIAYFSFFLLPRHGLTHIVLNWGNRPSDLDVYVIPLAVRDWQDQPIEWRNIDGVNPPTAIDEQSPYVWRGLFEEGCSCTPDAAGGTSCSPTCFLEAGPGISKISLDRTDASHGSSVFESSDQFVDNGPETLTFQYLYPGLYRIYVNAPNEQFTGTFNVEIWLGNSQSQISFIDTVSHTSGLGQEPVWFYAGFLLVTSAQVTCTGQNRRVQLYPDGTQACYSWFAIASLVEENPLSNVYMAVTVSLTDVTDATRLSFAQATYRIFYGGTCTYAQCVGQVECLCPTSTPLESGPLGPVRIVNGWWNTEVPLLLTPREETYHIVISQDGFYDRITSLQVNASGTVVLDIVMVPVVPDDFVRIVLTWPGPAELDLFVARDADPTQDGFQQLSVASEDFVWNERSSIEGIVQNRFPDSYREGKTRVESILMDANTALDSTYRLGVIVFGNLNGGGQKCSTATDSACSFFGDERIEVYGENGLLFGSEYSPG